MKFGFRKPNFKKSFKAKTTGKFKRSVKKATNPFYGKKGMGWVKNPKRAMRNKVYKKTTVGMSDFLKPKKSKSRSSIRHTPNRGRRSKPSITITANADTLNNVYSTVQNSMGSKKKTITLILAIFLGFFGVHRFYVGKTGTGILYLFSFGLLGIGWIYDIIMLFTGNFKDVNNDLIV